MRNNWQFIASSFFLLTLAACSGDDEGVVGKNVDGGAQTIDGSISGLDGAVGDAGADTQTGPIACTHNAVCDSDQHCALYYNGVKALEGDGEPPKLPGWANICEDDTAGKAQEGELCDPYANDADATLKACVNSSTCMQGICTALCEEDSHCPADTRCGVTEYGATVAAKDGSDATAWLPIDLCVPMAGDSGACKRDADCKDTETCRPWVKRVNGGFTSEGRCVTSEPGKQAYDAPCGEKADGKGLGKLCDSSLCLYATKATAGVCSKTCDSSADCKDTIDWNGQTYPAACDSLLTNHAGTSAPEDDVYIPHCVAVNQQSSLKDCGDTQACEGTEACRAFAITRGADTATKLEYRCVQLKTTTQPKGPTLEDGAACDPFAGDVACKGGYCLLNADATGVCGRLCKDDAGCGGGTKCDKGFVLIPRKDTAKAGVVGMCRN